MGSMGPRLDDGIGANALSVWLDFWELTGKFRVDIKSYTESGGDPAKMVPPVIQVETIPAVRAIKLSCDEVWNSARPGQMPSGGLKLELIDRVNDSDRLVIGGQEYFVDQVVVKDMGNFRVWIVWVNK